MNYLQYIQSPTWKGKAALAKQRAQHRCQVCNSGLRLNVHHRTYERLGHEDPRDLIVLCRSCHELFERPLPEPPEPAPEPPTMEDQELWDRREEWLAEVGQVIEIDFEKAA